MARRDSNPLQILHVEDDDNDALLFMKACERGGLPVDLHRVGDAEQARMYLLGLDIYADRAAHPLPQIIVLDLKMPRMDGFEFLKWLRGKEAFAAIPVLVFTASVSKDDKSRALAEGANSYFVKPTSFEALVQMVQGFQPPGDGRLN